MDYRKPKGCFIFISIQTYIHKLEKNISYIIRIDNFQHYFSRHTSMIYSIIHILLRLIGDLQYLRYYSSIFQKVNNVGSALVMRICDQNLSTRFMREATSDIK